MSRLLSELLGAREPTFTLALKQLENASGNTNADIRLTAEIIGKTQLKTRELGLDPKDTKARELYHGLFELTRLHDKHLANALGVKDPGDIEELLPRIKSIAHKLHDTKTCWGLKHSTAKRLLLANPPKNIMKILGYRSVESMVKRENIAELFCTLRFAESPRWLERFVRNYRTLTPADFENRQIETIILDPRRWGEAAKDFVYQRRHNITHLKEFGAIAILPMPIKRLEGITITVLPLLLHYMNEIRLYSAFFKLRQVRPNFGEVVAETIVSDPSEAASLYGHGIHWRIIHRYLGSFGRGKHPEFFEPHLQPEDLDWRKAEDVLYKIEPSLAFWRDLDYVGTANGKIPVSFNLMDMAVCFVNGLEFKERVVYHMREALWNEIFIRYLGHEVFEQAVLKQLDNGLLAPEKLGRVARKASLL